MDVPGASKVTGAPVREQARREGVRAELEAFSDFAGGEEGLSGERLVLLASGFARCIDEEIQERAEICQVHNGRVIYGAYLGGENVRSHGWRWKNMSGVSWGGGVKIRVR